MRSRFGFVFWMKCLISVVVIVGLAGAFRTVKGGPTLPHDRLVRSGDAMDLTWRYRVQIEYSLPNGDLRNVAEVHVNNPEDYLVRIQSDGGISEVLAVQERLYSRYRRFVVEEGKWSDPQARGLVMYPSLGPFFFPATAIQSISAAYETVDLGPEFLDGVPVAHYQGKLNPAYAYQRAYSVWLVRTRRAKGIKEGSLGTSPPTLSWVEKFSPTLRGRLDTQEEAMRFFAEHPATVDIWVHPKDKVAYMVQITMPPEAASQGLPDGVIRFRFRDFNHDFDVSPFPRYPIPPEPTLVVPK
jgi:hypothetical protein